MFRRIFGLVAIVILALSPVAAQAARVSPMIVDLTPIGRGAVGRVELTNTDPRTFPAEVQMMRGEISETGELTLTPADDDFLVFPAQAVIQPQSQQVFRVQYVGEPDLAQSQIYYMAIRQVPVDLGIPETSQVQVVVHFNVLVNVVPDGATPQPVVQSAQAATRNGVNGVEVRVTNNGTRYFTAGMLQWALSGTGANGAPLSQTIEAGQMSRLVGVGVVAPGKSRVFFVPTTEAFQGNVQVNLRS